MASYGISRYGAESLRQVADDIRRLNDEIVMEICRLQDVLKNNSDKIGPYEEPVMQLSEYAGNIASHGQYVFSELAGRIVNKADEIDSLLDEFDFSGDSL